MEFVREREAKEGDIYMKDQVREFVNCVSLWDFDLAFSWYRRERERERESKWRGD